jgi:hypothetical protein
VPPFLHFVPSPDAHSITGVEQFLPGKVKEKDVQKDKYNKTTVHN